MNLNNLFGSSDTNEGLADEFAAMARAKGMNVRIPGTPAQERERTQQLLAQRAAERKKTDQATARQDFANLADLESQYKQMKNKYDALGGSNWQYADREQNLTTSEREARDMEYGLNILGDRISRAKKSQGMAEGDDIGYLSMKPLQTGDTIKYLGQKAKVIELSKDKQHARITIASDFGGITKTVKTSDLQRLGQGTAEGSLNEFADGGGGDSGNYFQALASAWYNHDISMLADIARKGGSPLKKITDAQEAVEKMLQRGVIGSDGKTRKYDITYNSDFDGVVIQSKDYYEYSDYDAAGNEVDSRNGRPWGPNDYMEFGGDDLDEGAPVTATTGSIDPGGAVDNFKQQMANNTEIAYQKGMAEGQFPDTSNSLAKRSAVVTNLKGAPSKAGRGSGMTVATRVEPTITSTKVQRKDDRPIPSFLQKEGSLNKSHGVRVARGGNNESPV
jgi:hypothetical protein